GGGTDGEFLVTVDIEPGPAGAETRGGGLGELFLELVEAAEGRVDRLGEFALRGATFAGADNRPEEGVVGVAAAVVTNRAADGFRNLGEVGDQIADALGGVHAGVGEGLVHVGDVGLVM